ncbi:patatin-like phospholipase family protein [Actinomycetospora termitidis]|uniref:Patatin-like phospholipase family protein n=1 Tax=Actinomycetospora termitidis TaxID=3053470 RepID=A0ABT7MAT3_9PSEU|nr:patatin-like phospholipase family protein [Actinomycetospora sp. Odt1-22]MDL5157771.1 patatin-like phospholipase family protein [Actinomycetospora sp. Odt1-22]
MPSRHRVLDLLASRRAEGSGPGDRSDPYRLALAIEGGGSRATYSSGMVLGLERLGLARCFDAVYGASAGALAGSWLVGGQAEACCAGWWEPGLMERVTRPRRGLRGRPVVDVEYLVETVGRDVVPVDWQAILSAEVPLHPVATDVDTGEAFDLHGTMTDVDSLRLALRASANVPLLAGLPIEIHGRRLVDAAVAEPLPFHTALDQGATHVLMLRTRRADQEAIDATRLEKALVGRLGQAKVPGLVHVLGNRLENRRADDEWLARASALDADDPGDGPFLLEVRPPEGADTINPLETDPDRLRRGVETGCDTLRALVEPYVPSPGEQKLSS